jgi:hypothetical protein
MLNDILQMQQVKKLLYHFKGSGIKSVTISFIAAVLFRQRLLFKMFRLIVSIYDGCKK